MHLKTILAASLLLLSTPAFADEDMPWRISAYGGVATRNDTTQGQNTDGFSGQGRPHFTMQGHSPENRNRGFLIHEPFDAVPSSN